MTAPCEPVLAPDTRFGPYVIVRRLGAGAFGGVYEATRQPLRKRVALKVLHGKLAADAEVNARFMREARAAAQLSHPHVVDIFDVGEERGVPYLAMEFLEGETLAERLRREGPLPVTVLADVMLPVLSAVAAVHAAGIVHRDVKPDNLFLAVPRPGVVHPKLLDFGIAKVYDATHEVGLTESRALLGTPHYMSPEQAQQSRHVDALSDQFALGVVLYECATGRRPFEGRTLYEILHAVVAGAVARPRALRADLAPAFEAVILRAMARDRARRFPSARALGAALLPFASDAARAEWSAEFAGAPDAAVADTVPSPALESLVASAAVFDGATLDDPAGVGSAPTLAPDAAGTLRATERRARSVDARPRRWLALAGVGAVVVASVGALAVAGRRGTDGSSPVAAPAPGAAYEVVARVAPPTAAIEVDGAPAGHGVLVRTFPRDGVAHTIRVTAPGYESQTVTFRDAPPPGEIALAAAPMRAPAAPPAAPPPPPPSPGAARRPPRRPGPVAAESAPAAPPAPAPPAAPAAPPRPGTNGVANL